jgi:hypothetical protein
MPAPPVPDRYRSGTNKHHPRAVYFRLDRTRFARNREMANLPANVKVVLIVTESLSLENGAQLANYAIDVNLGGSVVSEYQIKRLDLDYFDCE